MVELQYFVHLLVASLKYQSVYNVTDWQRQFNAINFEAFFRPLMARVQNLSIPKAGLSIRHKHIVWEHRSSYGNVAILQALVVISQDGATAIFKSSVTPISSFWKNLNEHKIGNLHPDHLVKFADVNGLPMSPFLSVASKAEFTESEVRLFNGQPAAQVEIYFPLNWLAL